MLGTLYAPNPRKTPIRICVYFNMNLLYILLDSEWNKSEGLISMALMLK